MTADAYHDDSHHTLLKLLAHKISKRFFMFRQVFGTYSGSKVKIEASIEEVYECTWALYIWRK